MFLSKIDKCHDMQMRAFKNYFHKLTKVIEYGYDQT